MKFVKSYAMEQIRVRGSPVFVATSFCYTKCNFKAVRWKRLCTYRIISQRVTVCQKSRSKMLNGLRRHGAAAAVAAAGRRARKKPFTCAWLHLSVRQPAHAAKDPMHINSAGSDLHLQGRASWRRTSRRFALGLSYLSRWALGRHNNNTLSLSLSLPHTYTNICGPKAEARVFYWSRWMGCWGLTWVSALFSPALSLCVVEWMYIGIRTPMYCILYICMRVENEANPPDEGTRRAKNAAAAAPPAACNIASQINARGRENIFRLAWHAPEFCVPELFYCAFKQIFTPGSRSHSHAHKNFAEILGSDFSARVTEIWRKKLLQRGAWKEFLEMRLACRIPERKVG